MRNPLHLLTFPATLAHELTHAAASWPWATKSDLGVEVFGTTAYYDVYEWRQDTPEWAKRIAHVAPTLMGTFFALVVCAWIVAGGGRLPSEVSELGVWLLAFAYWLIYTGPSGADISGFNPWGGGS